MGPGIPGSTDPQTVKASEQRCWFFHPHLLAECLAHRNLTTCFYSMNEWMNEDQDSPSALQFWKCCFEVSPKVSEFCGSDSLSVRLMRDPRLQSTNGSWAGFSPGERDNSEKIHQLWRWVACLPIWMTGPDLFIHLEILRLTFYSFSFLLLWIMMTIIIIKSKSKPTSSSMR